MRLLAPINSLDSCMAQIEAGADELYVGLKVGVLKQLHFSARSQTYNDISIMPSKEELKAIVTYAHDKNVIVSLAANIAYITDHNQFGINLEQEYLKYVLEGVDCGVDNIIVTDIGLIDTLRKMNLPVKIHSSTILDTMSIEQMLFLREIGVSRAILSYQIGYTDLKEITTDKPLEIEIFGYGGCSFSAYCNLGHGLDFGIPCKNMYCLNDSREASNLLDSTKGCCLCSIWDLNNFGVDSLKLIGREFYYKQVTPITELFKKVILLAKNTTKEEFTDKVNDIVPVWHKKGVCKKGQCKYKNKAEEYYI